jgi:hypothetical protein
VQEQLHRSAGTLALGRSRSSRTAAEKSKGLWPSVT